MRRQPVLVAAGDVQQPQLLGRLRVVLDEVVRLLRVRGRGEAADPGERVEVAQPEVERLPAAHRQAGQGARLAVGLHRVGLLDERDQVVEQVLLERGERRRLLGDRIPRRHVLRRPAVGQDDDHRHGLLVGVQVVEDHVGRAAARPLVLVAADAVQQVQDRVLLVLRVPRRGVDPRLALHPDRRRVVLDRLQLAALDAVAAGCRIPWAARGTSPQRRPSSGRAVGPSRARPRTPARPRRAEPRCVRSCVHPPESERTSVRRPAPTRGSTPRRPATAAPTSASASSGRSAPSICAGSVRPPPRVAGTSAAPSP